MPDDIPGDWSRLATFLQISDLHIGEIDPLKGDATVSATAAQFYGTTTWFDGLLGHHGAALEALEEFCDRLRTQDEGDFQLIVTGDLTRTGDYMDFFNATRFLNSSLDLSPPTMLRAAGLGMGSVDLVIPGNHDQWGGSFVAFGGGPSQYGAYITSPVPRVYPAIPLANGRQVVFIAIDSDADVWALSHDRQLALGKFASQLTHPNALPPHPPDPNDIRMMLIHHSWEQGGKILRMRTQSKNELGKFLVRHHIKGILTGHSHGPWLDYFTVSPSGVVIAELRAGTASQLDQVPANWGSVWGGSLPTRKWDPNSVLVHRVFDDGAGQTHWHAQVYRRSETTGFQELVRPGSSLMFQV